MIVRSLTPEERERMRACLVWCQREREPNEPEDYTEKRLDEARRLWPDVAELIGFALALPGKCDECARPLDESGSCRTDGCAKKNFLAPE